MARHSVFHALGSCTQRCQEWSHYFCSPRLNVVRMEGGTAVDASVRVTSQLPLVVSAPRRGEWKAR